MSIKKAIPLFFLLLANVVMLAHVAVHHDPKHRDSYYHEHQGNSSPNTCCIDIYIHVSNSIKSSCRLHKKCDCEQVVYALPFNAALNAQDFVDETIIHFRKNPYVLLFYSEFISQSIGLRAPPSF
jgi:hypothetical protein